MRSQDWRGGRVREVAGELNHPGVPAQERDFFSGALLSDLENSANDVAG